MKRLIPTLALLPFLCGCQFLTNLKSDLPQMTSAQAIQIGQPLVTGGLVLVLQNNPKYVPIATKVGADLASANWTDLTLTGVNSTINAIVVKEGGTAALSTVIQSAVDAGLAGYLDAVAEATLAKDPNAVLVLQALGKSVSTAAAAVTPVS
jgi:hypothetical protein